MPQLLNKIIDFLINFQINHSFGFFPYSLIKIGGMILFPIETMMNFY